MKIYLRTTKNLFCDVINGYMVYYIYNTAVWIRLDSKLVLS